MVRRQQLTDDQAIILEHVAEVIKTKGESPTFSEVSEFTGFTTSKVQRTIEKCIGLKLLRRKPLVKNGLKLGSKYKEYIEND